MAKSASRVDCTAVALQHAAFTKVAFSAAPAHDRCPAAIGNKFSKVAMVMQLWLCAAHFVSRMAMLDTVGAYSS